MDASVDLELSRIITQSCSPVIIDFSIHFPCQWSRLGNLELNYEEHVLRACEHVLRIWIYFRESEFLEEYLTFNSDETVHTYGFSYGQSIICFYMIGLGVNFTMREVASCANSYDNCH